MLARVPREAPVNVHWQITTGCNLTCPDCWYKGPAATVPFEKAASLVEEWVEAGVKSIAIGGGEPMFVPWLGRLVRLARNLGMYVAVTTNGTVFRTDVQPDRMAFSWDSLHARTWDDGVMPVMQRYQLRGVEIGVNHVLSDWEAVERVYTWMQKEGLLRHEDGSPALTLILKKPRSEFEDWGKLNLLPRGSFAMDACLAKKVYGIPCRQGQVSMFVSADGLAGVCSNVRARRTYVGLKETFSALPEACLYEEVPCG